MIGTGILVLTGLAAEIAGPAAILVFALNGVVTAFTGLSYAELAASIPKSGGGYAFVREIFDDFASSSWVGALVRLMIAGALYALGFAPTSRTVARLRRVPDTGRARRYSVPVICRSPIGLFAGVHRGSGLVALTQYRRLLICSVRRLSQSSTSRFWSCSSRSVSLHRRLRGPSFRRSFRGVRA